ncbi:hypothetical protein [Thermosulfurimonas sp. F29]|uniref:hypothetical protein n=1 Tax=Thermosulfurimonas sp. F29 TaxID=2867247 RepID=UPI001C83AEBA|nr:hypothetical protein [Thermosulfurimonas sp. F29]MBX6424280.1 hypothetical protein [Thermosulfurimonas sp. F29]
MKSSGRGTGIVAGLVLLTLFLWTGGGHGEEAPFCITGTECGPGSYCFREKCDLVVGKCTARPDFCPEVYRPVCGCDGRYSNACFAAMAGVPVAYEGACEGAPLWLRLWTDGRRVFREVGRPFRK